MKAILKKIFTKYFGADGVFEEALEEWLKEKLGIDVDLTPSSKEKTNE